jgi:hypothetical protein
VGDIIKLLDAEKPDGVVFSAGAGGKGGEERTKAVDYEGELSIPVAESCLPQQVDPLTATNLCCSLYSFLQELSRSLTPWRVLTPTVS